MPARQDRFAVWEARSTDADTTGTNLEILRI